MKSAYANGIYYEYSKKHSKYSIVFIHGSGCNHNFFKPLANYFKDDSVYLIDMPHHGKSNTDCAEDLDAYADAMFPLISSIGNVILVGHSLGGVLAMLLASKPQHNIKKLVILNSALKLDRLSPEFADMIQRKKINVFRLLKYIDPIYKPSVIRCALQMEPFSRMIADFHLPRQDEAGFLQNIKAETLIVASKRDNITLVSYSQTIKDLIPGSRLAILEHGKHLMPVTQAKKVSHVIADFAEM